MRRLLSAAVFTLLATLPLQANEAGLAQAVIGGQIDSFKAQRHGEAFSNAAPGIRLMFRNETNFIRMVKKGYMPIYGARDYRFGRTRVDGATLYQEVLLTGPNGRSWVALYTMARAKDGSWKIAGVRLVPGNEQST